MSECFVARLFCLFVSGFTANGYGHTEPVSYPLTLFLGNLILTTKRLTSPWRAGEHASGSN